MRSFASDNNSGVHPLVMDAVIKANDNHAVGYGDDPWTAAATAKIKEVFGEMASPFFVFNGTGANTVALQAVTRPFNSILCAENSSYQCGRVWCSCPYDWLCYRDDSGSGRKTDAGIDQTSSA